MKNIKINLKNLRKSRELTQQELADYLGVSRQSIIAVENGKFLPSIELALQMANFFNTRIEELFDICEQSFERINIPAMSGEEDNMRRELSPWHPYHEAEPFRHAMDRLFDDFFGDEDKTRGQFIPSIELSQKDNQVVVKVEVPGINPDSINISVEEDSLTIEGERKSEEEEKDKEFYRKEILYGSFSRTIPLPQKVDPEKAQAKFKNGLLTISIPEIEPKKLKGKTVRIEEE